MEILINILDYIKTNIDNNYTLTLIFFFIFLILYNSFSIPGNLIFISSTGYFFGIYIGFFISITSIVLGSFIFFLFANLYTKKLIPKKIYKYSIYLKNHIKDSSLEYLIIFRMIPGTPLFLQNILFSFLNISKIKFILSSFLGFTPLVFVVVFVGNQFKDLNKFKNLSFIDFFSFNFLIFIVLIIIFLLIRIFYKNK